MPSKRKPETIELAKEIMGRLEIIMSELSIKKIDFQRAIGIGQSSVSQWFIRKNLPETYYFAKIPEGIFKLTGTWINLHWLATGMGQPYYRDDERESTTDAYARGSLTAVAKMEETLTAIRRPLLARAEEAVQAAVEVTEATERARSRPPVARKRSKGRR